MERLRFRPVEIEYHNDYRVTAKELTTALLSVNQMCRSTCLHTDLILPL